MSESLKGKVAVISGVASGFAKATAELFSKKDQCNFVMFDINEKGLEDTAKNCIDAGSKVIYFKGDAIIRFQRSVTEFFYGSRVSAFIVFFI